MMTEEKKEEPDVVHRSFSRSAKPSSMSRQQVLEHSNADELLLIIIRDRIYDCTLWQHTHPGGHLTLRSLCGKDATDAFVALHPDHVERSGMLSRYEYSRLSDVGKPSETTVAFRELTDTLKADGWFETDYSFYYKKMLFLAALFSAVVFGVTSTTSLWIHALSGALLALFWQQVAFIGHDLGHNSVTHNRQLDSDLGLLIGNALTGISIGWWKRSHNVHHIVTNSIDHDPDIQHLPVFAIDSEFLTRPVYSSFFKWYLPLDNLTHLLVRHQHWLYYPIMSVARFNLYAQSWLHALGVGAYKDPEVMWRRNLQLVSLALFWTWLLALTLNLPTWTSRVVFFMLAHMFAGILHVQITLSHFVMPAYSGVTYDYHNKNNGFVETQLETSLDIDCPLYLDWFHGGLQFQIEHHLWPRVPRHRLRALKPILQAFCQQHSLHYHQAGFLRGNAILLQRLKRVAATTKSWSEMFGDSVNLRG